jgi:hypothetical protein
MHVRKSVVVSWPGFGFTGFDAAIAEEAASATAAATSAKCQRAMG